MDIRRMVDMRVASTVATATITLILVATVLLNPASAQSNYAVALTPNVTIHPEDTLVWVDWNCIYESKQPCVFDTTYFIIGGIKWVIDSTGAVNITMNRYTPEDLYHDGGIGFNFTVIPKRPCKIRFEIIGVPRGEYVIHRITSVRVENITAHASELKFSDYVTQPTKYVVQIKTFEGAPTKPAIPPIPPPIAGKKKPTAPSFEAVFAIAGLIGTAYLLNRRNN